MSSNREDRKQRIIFEREYAKSAMWYSVAAAIGAVAVLVLVVVALAIWYGPGIANAWTHSLKASAEQTEHITATAASGFDRLDRILEKAEPQIDVALSNALGASNDAHRITTDAAQRLPIILENLAATAKAPTGPLTEAQGLLADSRPLIRQNLATLNDNQRRLGESLPRITDAAADAAGSVRTITDTILKSPGYVTTFGDDGSLVSLNRTFHNAEPIPIKFGVTQDRVNATMLDVNRISKDSADKFHAIVFPEPCHDWGCRIKRGLGTVYRFADFGLRVKHEFSGLPVDIFHPVTVIQKSQ